MHSALYVGWLDHRRVAPRRHAFRYALFMAWIDLAELDRVFRGRWLWSCRRPALMRFDRRDHFGDIAESLDESVRRLVAERTGQRPSGPIRLLTNLRCFGYVFNPVSFYYCYDASDTRVETIVAEVTNTPWGERHCYVLQPGLESDRRLHARSDKCMHVSPFHPMALEYDWAFGVPAAALDVHMSLRPQPAPGATQAPPVFGATLALQRREISTRSLATVLLRHPFMTAKVIAAIHWEALRLWLKRVPVHDHPGTAQAARPQAR